MTKQTKLTKSALPKGYTAITADAETHDWDATPTLEGTIKRAPETVNLADGPRRVMHIERDSDGERVAVWESSGLRALFECSVGDKVFIAFTGLGVAKNKKHSPPRLFEVGVQKNDKPM